MQIFNRFPEVKMFNEPVTDQTKWVSRVTKITLLHTDATSSEIKLISPIYSTCGEVQEYTRVYLAQYINHMTRYFLSLVGYQISLGSIDVDGNEHYSMPGEPFQIPTDKIYFKGKWRTEEKIKEMERKMR